MKQIGLSLAATLLSVLVASISNAEPLSIVGAGAQDWGFQTDSGSYVFAKRAETGILNGQLYKFANGFVDESQTIDFSGVNSTKGVITIESSGQDNTISFIRTTLEGNTYWKPEECSTCFNLPLHEGWLGVTNRSDSIAEAGLEVWGGNPDALYRSDIYYENIEALSSFLGIDNSTLKMVVPRSAVPFWNGIVDSVGTVKSPTFSVSTLGQSKYGDSALVVMDKGLWIDAITDDATRKAALTVSAYGQDSFVIEADFAGFTIKVSMRSIFDDYVDASGNFSDQSVIDLFSSAAPSQHCTPRRYSSSLLMVVCDYHSTEYGYGEEIWMRTTIAFRVIDPPDRSLRTVIVNAISQFENASFADKPSEDQWRLIDPRAPNPYKDLQGRIVTKLISILQNKYTVAVSD